ncbi:MAG TPA: hypothetical protein VM680_09855 [Verrucomicrobiae bacterium]|nr:hypothetical protein [Verrucomicrobiae bacterium]
MNQREKIVFGIAVLLGGIFCAALAMGRFSPPPEEIATRSGTALITAAVDVVTNIVSETRVIHFVSKEKESDLEEAEMLASNRYLDLLDTTSPLPTVNFR